MTKLREAVRLNDTMHSSTTYRICVLCSGNICRSPMGEVILRDKLAAAGLAGRVVVDSAGTGGWHEGDPADDRTITALHEHGYDGSAHRAREFRPSWFAGLDLVLVADRGHLERLRQWAPTEADAAKVRLMREFDEDAVEAGTLEVDDPYFGEAADFERCLVEVERACEGVVAHLGSALVAQPR
jgi:protein-tyrosine phosphatase